VQEPTALITSQVTNYSIGSLEVDREIKFRGLRCGAFAFFKLHRRVGSGVGSAYRDVLVPAGEGLCILSS
jgi:hypothetical protein